MKIAMISNFDDETFTEYFVAHDLSEHNAEVMCFRLNEHPDADNDCGYYFAVPDDYVLSVRDS